MASTQAEMAIRPECANLPEMPEAELRALAADIDEVGQLVDILTIDGAIVDGRSRYRAITEFCASGIKPRFKEYKGDLPPFRLVYSLNVPRRHLTAGQKALLVLESWDEYKRAAKERMASGGRGGNAATPLGKARDDAAKDAGVASRTIEDAKTVRDGGSTKVIEAVKSGRVAVNRAAQVVRKTADKREQNNLIASIETSNNSNRVTQLTGEVEWYTPSEYIEAARDVMGSIDLDPASSKVAQKTVKARHFFSLERSAFEREWSGNVFLNPPYRMPDVAQFVDALLEEYHSGRVLQAILLTNTASDTAWYRRALAACTLSCQTGKRIRFLEYRDGLLEERKSPTCNQTFFYFGKKEHRFVSRFQKIGNVLQLVAAYEGENGTATGA